MSIAFANMTIRFLDKLCIFDKPYSVSIVLSIKINGKKTTKNKICYKIPKN